MSKLELQTGPTEEPLSVAEVRLHLRIDDGDEDAKLGMMIAAVRKQFEESYWTQFCTATYDQYFDGFHNQFKLARPPVGTVATVKYTDVAGDEQTVDATVWEQGLVNDVGVVRTEYNQTWPTGARGHPDSVVIRYTAGYGDADDVPEPIRQAMLIYCEHLYEHRGLTITGSIIATIPKGIDSLMGAYSFRELTR